MNISKELEWLRPYIEASCKLVPVLNLKKVIALHPNEKRINRCQAQITKEGSTYYVCLYVAIYKLDKLPSTRVLAYYTKIDLLCNLAHELAHLTHWLHTCDHKILEARLIILYMRMLSREGYVSEEEEQKHPPFK